MADTIVAYTEFLEARQRRQQWRAERGRSADETSPQNASRPPRPTIDVEPTPAASRIDPPATPAV
jgi:hypothetical protein